jgi:hypothetical protein
MPFAACTNQTRALQVLLCNGLLTKRGTNGAIVCRQTHTHTHACGAAFSLQQARVHLHNHKQLVSLPVHSKPTIPVLAYVCKHVLLRRQ